MSRGPRSILDSAGLKPKKSFGQNFLTDTRVVEAIAAACVPEPDVGRAHVVEIGAGTGALTQALLARARHTVAIERDRDLLPLLAATFSEAIADGTLALVEADAARVDLVAALGAASPRVLAGNLPYQITGRLIERACHAAASFERAVFMVQREVADRLIAAPDNKEYGGLSVFVQAAFRVSRVMAVSRGAFFPQPAVDSAVVLLEPRADRVEETAAFRALVKAAFEQRRKTLRNAWSGVAERADIERAAAVADISLDARGETLGVRDFARMASELDSLKIA